jgi:prevent-host-death family protein
MQENEKAAFDEAFAAVENGESFTINLRGKPLAVLIPYEDYRLLRNLLDEMDHPSGP